LVMFFNLFFLYFLFFSFFPHSGIKKPQGVVKPAVSSLEVCTTPTLASDLTVLARCCG